MWSKVSIRSAISFSLTFSVTLGAAMLQSQQTAADVPSTTIHANTRLVVVDVVVTNKHGEPMAGLKPDDFTLEENGKKEKVAIFVPPGAVNKASFTPPPRGVFSNHPESVSPAGIPTVLLLDGNSPFKDQSYARSQMLKYVVEHGESGSSIAVMTLTDRLHVLQTFTSDAQILIAAIKRLKPDQPVLAPSTARPLSATAAGDSAAAAALALAQRGLEDFSNLQIGYALERRTVITLEAMRSLSRMLSGLPGRKHVVWLTAEFPFNLRPEFRTISASGPGSDLPNARKNLENIGENPLAAQQQRVHSREIRDVESQMASAGIAIYPVDIRGLMVSGTDVASTTTMEEIAAETGGKAYTNQNEIKLGIALAAADAQASYSLGYYPENKKWDGQYRNIRVRLSKGDAQLRYRKGYFAIEPGPFKGHNYEQDVAEALEIDAPATQISFQAEAKPAGAGKVKVLFLVDGHTLASEESADGRKMDVSLYASVYGSNGKMLGFRSARVNRTFDDGTYKQIMDKGMLVPLDLEIPTGGQQLRMAVLDNKTGYIGTVSGALGQ